MKYGGAKEGIVGAAESFGAMLNSEVNVGGGGRVNTIYNPANNFCAPLVCFTAAMRMTLGALDDDELYVFGRPLPLPQLLGAIKAIKVVLYSALVHNPAILSDPLGGVSSDDKEGSSLSVAAEAYADSVDAHTRQFQYSLLEI